MRKLPVTFDKWVQKFADEDSQRGDLARRMRDRMFPAFGGKRDIIAFMEENKYTQDQIALFKELWQEYYRDHKHDMSRVYEIRSITRNEFGT